jgi:hypothetical protein
MKRVSIIHMYVRLQKEICASKEVYVVEKKKAVPWAKMDDPRSDKFLEEPSCNLEYAKPLAQTNIPNYVIRYA